jgi:hypothetical protein
MPTERAALTPKQRDLLFGKLRDDPAFREAMKKDWRSAVTTLKIKPDAIVKGALSRREIDDFINQRAGWTIEIVIAGRVPGQERVEINQAVNFQERER